MTLIEAARQALDALELFGWHEGECELHDGNECSCGFDDAIINLSTAISEAEKHEPVAWVGRLYAVELHEYMETKAYSENGGESSCIPLYAHPAPAVPEG